jgi:hypothetical protein
LSLSVALLLALAGHASARPRRPVSSASPSRTTEVAIESDGANVLLEMQRVPEPMTTTDGSDAATSSPAPAVWEPACAEPCARALPRAALFRVTGPELISSPDFNLPPDRDSVTLSVRPGVARWYWTGILASAFGGSLVLGGAGPPLLLGGSFSTTEKILAGTGLAMLAVGLPFWILNRTTVSLR